MKTKGRKLPARTAQESALLGAELSASCNASGDRCVAVLRGTTDGCWTWPSLPAPRPPVARRVVVGGDGFTSGFLRLITPEDGWAAAWSIGRGGQTLDSSDHGRGEQARSVHGHDARPFPVSSSEILAQERRTQHLLGMAAASPVARQPHGRAALDSCQATAVAGLPLIKLTRLRQH
jgi:hypothetical protein